MSVKILLAIVIVTTTAARGEVVIEPAAGPRVHFSAEKLRNAIHEAGVTGDIRITRGSGGRPEGFTIDSQADGSIVIAGDDDSGTMYGCLELAAQIAASKRLPKDLHFSDAPAFKLRGPCIGMQKPALLPGRSVYEYPYTPELFPFFYDKRFWEEYLDFLAANRMNTLYLWNGHPFASLVKLKDYPYALEVSDEVFARNQEMFRYITSEADKRGIWVVQMFYSILISKPFSEKHGLSTQLAAPDDRAADYTRKSIAEFVRSYPHVGLMVCLGEALSGQENQTRWLAEVILPGVKDGMEQAKLAEEPPVIIRTHATDLRKAMPQALKVYKNLYTEAKFNGESLTTWEPRGKWQEIHLDMSRLGSTHLMNVHILANLEPFRYGAQRFIKKCVQAGRDRLGAKGLHLYPLSYWNWPDAPDKIEPPLAQIKRDWIWFEAWGRYAWDPDIDEETDRAWWIQRLERMYGNASAAEKILDAYNDSGECAPRLVRRFGITEGNRQTLSLGMTLDQLVHPEKYSVNPDLWESQAPSGERLDEFMEREWNHQAHEGETPGKALAEVMMYSRRACEQIDAAAALVTASREEFARLRNDIHCIRAMSLFYAAKVEAAVCVLRFERNGKREEMVRAAQHLEESLKHFRDLAALTETTYTYANSMQTRQRKIPIPGGVDGKPAYFHWSQLVPLYEQELKDFQVKVAGLR